MYYLDAYMILFLLTFPHDERDVPVVNDNGLLGDDVEVDSELEVCRFSVFYIP